MRSLQERDQAWLLLCCHVMCAGLSCLLEDKWAVAGGEEVARSEGGRQSKEEQKCQLVVADPRHPPPAPASPLQPRNPPPTRPSTPSTPLSWGSHQSRSHRPLARSRTDGPFMDRGPEAQRNSKPRVICVAAPASEWKGVSLAGGVSDDLAPGGAIMLRRRPW